MALFGLSCPTFQPCLVPFYIPPGTWAQPTWNYLILAPHFRLSHFWMPLHKPEMLFFLHTLNFLISCHTELFAVHPIVFYTCAQIISCWSNLPSIFCLSGQVPSTLKNNQTFPGEPSGPYNNTGFLCWAPFTLLNASLLLIAPECNKTNRSKQWVFAILGDPDSRNWVLVLCLGPC